MVDARRTRTRAKRAAALALTIALLCGATAGCGRAPAPSAGASADASAAGAAGPTAGVFRDVTARTGVRFRHAHSRRGAIQFLPETLGPGVAALDHDGDGLLDLFFVQGAGNEDGKPVPACELYRRDASGASFEETAELASADVRGPGQAALAADLDNDGYPDLLVTSYRAPLRLLMNNGDGTFTERASRSGLPETGGWQTFATALDFDRDGLLDVYLGRYLVFGPEHFVEKPRLIHHDMGALPETMLPGPYPPEPKVLLKNRGDGRFADVTAAAGAANPEGKGMGALAADLNDDGWTDLFVANDVTPCALLENRKDGTFRDVAAAAYVGENRGSMGIAIGDWNRDARPDLVVSHWVGDVPALYERRSPPRRRMAFTDRAEASGLGRSPRDLVGWAVGCIDLENDGREALLVVNGHTNALPSVPGVLVAQKAVLFEWKGPIEGFEMVGPHGPGDPLERGRVGRGAVFCDLDHDGSTDVVLGCNNGHAEVWLTRSGAGDWLGVLPVGTRSPRDPVGARVELVAPHARTRQVVSGDSFFSSNPYRLLFGLGRAAASATVRVTWPSGCSEVFAGLAPRQYHRLVEGAGRE
jgi:hypothetical protein